MQEPFLAHLYTGEALRVAVGDDPEAALDRPLGANRNQIARSIGNEARQYAHTRTFDDQSMLRIDAGRADLRFKSSVEIIEVVQFGRIEQVGNIAHQCMTPGEVSGTRWRAMLSQVGFAGV